MESIGSDGGSLEPTWSGRIAGLWTEIFGDEAAAEPALLLSEAEAPSSRWPDELIAALCGATGAVIRFDTRDAGRNEPSAGAYSLQDLAADAVAILDERGVGRAHLIGRSMGGMIAQLVALDHADRVASLTLVSTTAGVSPGLPGPEAWLVDKMADRLFGDRPASVEERAEWIVEQLAWFSGRRYEFDRERAMAAARGEATGEWHDACGHGDAVVDAPARYHRLADIEVPTLVVHGTADPVYSPDHGLALADGIPGAHLELIDGLGHEVPAEFGGQLARLVEGVVERSREPGAGS